MTPRWLILIGSVLVAAGAGSGVALASANHQGKHSAMARSLTISIRPNPFMTGAQVKIAGRLTASNRARPTVVLWGRSPGAKTFHRVTTTAAGPLGRYRFLQVASTDRSWHATSRGLRSGTVTEHVHAKVSLSSSDEYPVPGDHVNLTGQVSPSHAGDHIVLQRQEGRTWKPVARERLSSRSRFSFYRRLGHRGRFTFRAVLPADAGNLWSRSLGVVLSVSEIHKIKHVVVIMQENRSFDQYFGTFRGVTGIPGLASNPGRPPCIPDPQNMYGRCDGPVAGDPAGVPGHRSAAEAGMLRAS